MNVLLTGAAGLLGGALAEAVPAGTRLFAFPRATLDITNAADLEQAIDRVEPDAILNAAAFTAVDRAEDEEESALRVNAAAMATMARLAARTGTRLVHFSTDYVFGGSTNRPCTEDAAPAPLNAYGRSKLAGERAALESGAKVLVVRTQWLFGPHGRCFAATMAKRASEGLATLVVDDQRGRPTYAPDLAQAVWRLLTTGVTGLLHMANAGSATRYELAREIFLAAGRAELCGRCTSADYPTPASRPSCCVLDTTRADRLLGAPLRSWRESVAVFLREVTKAGAR